MTYLMHVKEPPTLGLNYKNFSFWKKCMVNYLNILSLGDVVQHGYVPYYDPSNLTMTQKVKELKSQNDYAVNVILNSVSEKIAILFGTTEIASEMWETLLNRFEGNTQMKRTDFMGLESKFENFCIQDGESIENMYSRLMHILNEFDEVGEFLSNFKIVGKIFRAMMRRPRWESMLSTLEAMQCSFGEFTHEEVFNHLLCFEEKLRQNGELTPKLKETALQAQRSLSHHYLSKSSSSSSSMNDQVITKIFERMLNLEKKHNEERYEK
jgi:gag-polypeptide of LTR copia-type